VIKKFSRINTPFCNRENSTYILQSFFFYGFVLNAGDFGELSCQVRYEFVIIKLREMYSLSTKESLDIWIKLISFFMKINIILYLTIKLYLNFVLHALFSCDFTCYNQLMSKNFSN